MGAIARDLRYTFRLLLRSPWITAVAVISLALGIGANSAIFSFVDGMFLRPLPIENPDELVLVEYRGTAGQISLASFMDYADLRDQSSAFSGLIAQSRRGALLQVNGQVELVLCTVVSDNYFSVLGVDVAMGRTFRPELDENLETEPAVVISHSLWQRRFGGDSDLIGKTIQLNERDYTVVGIMSRSFRGLVRHLSNDVWVPTTTWAAMNGSRIDFEDRRVRNFDILGRLGPGVTLLQAQAQLDTIARRLGENYPDTNRETRFVVTPGSAEEHSRRVGMSLLLMAIVGLVLLIACVNVTNLLLTKTKVRRREISMRLALGAGGLRLLRQFLTEGFILALTGTVLGLLVTSWLVTLVPSLMPPGMVPMSPDVRLDGRVLMVTMAVSLLTVLLIGMTPLSGARKQDLVSGLKGEEVSRVSGRQRLTLRQVLVVGQIALSVILLVAAGLLLRSFLHSREMPLGFDTQKNMLLALVSPGPSARGADYAALYEELAERMESLPGVLRAGYARRAPLSMTGGGATRKVSIPGKRTPLGEDQVAIKYNQVASDYLSLMGTRILRGRNFDRRDHGASLKVTLINETMAERYWGEDDPIGSVLEVKDEEFRIIGVVEDAVINQIHETPEPFLYFPFEQVPSGETTLFIETASSPEAVAPLVTNELRTSTSKVRILSLMTLGQHMQHALYEDRMPAMLAGSLAVLGIFLAAVGLYGVVAFAALRRTHEIGIRMAIGAKRSAILRLVVGQGLRLALIGVPIGLVVAFSVTRLMSSLLYGVRPADPMTFVTSSVLVVVIAVAASYLPARKASKVDPIVALRYE